MQLAKVAEAPPSLAALDIQVGSSWGRNAARWEGEAPLVGRSQGRKHAVRTARSRQLSLQTGWRVGGLAGGQAGNQGSICPSSAA